MNTKLQKQVLVDIATKLAQYEDLDFRTLCEKTLGLQPTEDNIQEILNAAEEAKSYSLSELYGLNIFNDFAGVFSDIKQVSDAVQFNVMLDHEKAYSAWLTLMLLAYSEYDPNKTVIEFNDYKFLTLVPSKTTSDTPSIGYFYNYNVYRGTKNTLEIYDTLEVALMLAGID